MDSLIQSVHDNLAEVEPTPLLVGYSGGGDSTALLHLLASLSEARARGLRAIHVNHGMQPESTDWAAHCESWCAMQGIPLIVCKVNVALDQGDGPEFAARKARYAAFAENLSKDETLVLAQHADDQAETVLLKLLRGAGPEGLAGMRERRRFAGSWLWRPCLNVPHQVICAYLESHQLSYIDDPANADPTLARSYLRNEIMPRLTHHWPQARQAIQHSAALCQAASEYIDQDVAKALLERSLDDPATLEAKAWLALPPALRGPALARWLRMLDLPAPSHAQRHELERQISDARADRVPRVAWPGAELRVWRGRIHAMQPQHSLPPQWQADWNCDALELPAGGSLSLDIKGATMDPPLQVKLRRGGERMRPVGDAHTRDLRDLFQAASLAPWLRPGCPLIYRADRLIAVADIYCSEEGASLFAQLGGKPCWQHD